MWRVAIGKGVLKLYPDQSAIRMDYCYNGNKAHIAMYIIYAPYQAQYHGARKFRPFLNMSCNMAPLIGMFYFWKLATITKITLWAIRGLNLMHTLI